jgi:hypothetical protein
LKTIIYAWEIGDGYGHLQNLVTAARRNGEHHARFVVPESAVHAPAYLAERGFTDVAFLRAPPPIDWSRYPNAPKPFRTYSFSDVLAVYGYDCAERLRVLVKQVRDLCADGGLVVTDTAPTFDLIAVDSNNVGATWALPPQGEPMPAFGGDGAPSAPFIAEDVLCEEIERALGYRCGGSLSTWIAPTTTLPMCYPQLDVYGRGRGVGPARPFDPMAPLATPARFAYLDRGYPALAGVLGALVESSVPVRAHIKGDVTEGTYGALTLIGKFDLGAELRRADEVIHHGSSGLANSAFGAGRKQGCLPWHVENLCNARVLCDTGNAWMLGYEDLDQLREYLRATQEWTR